MLVLGHDAEVAAWVAARIPHMAGGAFGPCAAIGVVVGNEMVAGVVFHEFQPAHGTMMLSMAATSPRWATRGHVRGLLAYPFQQIGVHKLWTLTEAQNQRALRFNKGVGFRQEAVLRDQFGPKRHAVVCSMLAREWRKRWSEADGQRRA